MKDRTRSLMIVLGALTTYDAIAAPLDYECRVAAVSVTDASGKLTESPEATYVGSVFHVERSTGTILGSLLGNSAYPTKQVLDAGGADRSFKVLTSSEKAFPEQPVHTIYVEIAEYSEEPTKPFVAVEGGMVISGLCQ